MDFQKNYDSIMREVLYSHWVWYTHETGTANKTASGLNLQQIPGK